MVSHSEDGNIAINPQAPVTRIANKKGGWNAKLS
jgi:hypothetical protein